MSAFFTLALFVATGSLACVVTIYGVEVLAAVSAPRPDDQKTGAEGTIALLIPAHDEALTIGATLENLQSHVRPGDRILVVADNCTDNTAAIVRALGAEVIERFDLHRRGKGFALEHGVQLLRADPPSTVIVIDADCRVAPGAIERLAAQSESTGRPVQAEYVMLSPPGASVDYGLAAFAWRVKNSLRPRGLRRLSLPCQLMGTGMAFPWSLISQAKLGTDAIVEDLKLGIELAALGYAPLFCPSAVVTSYFPATAAGARTQRERWEGGHLNLIAKLAVPSFVAAVRRRDRDLLVMVLDMSVPPLTLLAAALGATGVITAGAALSGLSSVPFFISLASTAIFTMGVALAWLEYRDDVPKLGGLSTLRGFLLSKLGLYRRIFSGRSPSHWVRTERTPDDPPRS